MSDTSNSRPHSTSTVLRDLIWTAADYIMQVAPAGARRCCIPTLEIAETIYVFFRLGVFGLLLGST